MSGVSSVRRGKEAERAFARWMRDHGFPHTERLPEGFHDDVGDTTGHPGVTIDVKTRKKFDLAGWCDQLVDEMATAGNQIGAVVAKRRGTTDVGQWYAICPMHVLNRLLREAGYGDPIGDEPDATP